MKKRESRPKIYWKKRIPKEGERIAKETGKKIPSLRGEIIKGLPIVRGSHTLEKL